jgi:hypothetical protein
MSVQREVYLKWCNGLITPQEHCDAIAIAIHSSPVKNLAAFDRDRRFFYAPRIWIVEGIWLLTGRELVRSQCDPTDECAAALYRELQFALRASIGTRTLEVLLGGKGELDRVVFETVPDKVAECGVVMMNQVYGLYWRAFSSFRVCLESRNAAAIKHAESRRAQGMAGVVGLNMCHSGLAPCFSASFSPSPGGRRGLASTLERHIQ